MAVYAANGISRAGLWESGVAAIKLGATGYIIPFMFVFGPSLLLIGEWSRVALTVVTATTGVICLAAGLTGYLISTATWWQRLLLVAAAITLIKPGLTTDLLGAGMLAAVIITQLVFPVSDSAAAPDRPAPATGNDPKG